MHVRVIIAGLTSETGMQLNRFSGIANESDKDTDRWAILVPDGSRKKNKPENLKMHGGIMRTNAFAFETGGTEVVFENLSRINHSCVLNVVKQWFRRDGEIVPQRCGHVATRIHVDMRG